MFDGAADADWQVKWHILQPSAPHFTNITRLLTIASPDGRCPFLLGPSDFNPTVVRGQMRIFCSPYFLVFCLVQAVKWVAAVVIHDDGMVNVALTEATLPPSRRHLLDRIPSAATSYPSSRPRIFSQSSAGTIDHISPGLAADFGAGTRNW